MRNLGWVQEKFRWGGVQWDTKVGAMTNSKVTVQWGTTVSDNQLLSTHPPGQRSGSALHLYTLGPVRKRFTLGFSSLAPSLTTLLQKVRFRNLRRYEEMNTRGDQGSDILHLFADPVSTRLVLCLNPQPGLFLFWQEEGQLVSPYVILYGRCYLGHNRPRWKDVKLKEYTTIYPFNPISSSSKMLPTQYTASSYADLFFFWTIDLQVSLHFNPVKYN